MCQRGLSGGLLQDRGGVVGVVFGNVGSRNIELLRFALRKAMTTGHRGSATGASSMLERPLTAAWDN